jgi:hypothetical protein
MSKFPPVPSGPVELHPPVPSGPVELHPPVPSGPVVISNGYRARSKLKKPPPVFTSKQSFHEIIESLISYFYTSSTEKSDIIIYITVLKYIVSRFYDAIYDRILTPDIIGASALASEVVEYRSTLTSLWEGYQKEQSPELLRRVIENVRGGITALDTKISNINDEIIRTNPLKIGDFIKCVDRCKKIFIGLINFILNQEEVPSWNGFGGTRKRKRKQRRNKSLRNRRRR